MILSANALFTYDEPAYLHTYYVSVFVCVVKLWIVPAINSQHSPEIVATKSIEERGQIDNDEVIRRLRHRIR
jgi:hypothetical protein